MTITTYIIICSVAVSVAVIFAFCFGRYVGRSEKPFCNKVCEITEAFSLHLVHCALGAAICNRHGNDAPLEQLADILAGVHSHRLCYQEALDKLRCLNKQLKGIAV